MFLEQFIRSIPAPENPRETGTPKAWEKIEKHLGLVLPSDYKALINAYGTGCFADFIIVYNPFAQNEYHNLFFALDVLHQAARPSRISRGSAWTAVSPFELYPAKQGLLPWGCTSNFGDFFFWQVNNAPDTWETIFYNLRNGEYEVWKVPLTEFLYRLFTRGIESVLLPADFPPAKSRIAFVPA